MPKLFQHPYAELLERVEKPSRYTGAEHGTRRKDWSSVEARVCLAFPDIYDIGMSHLGYRILYKILNDDPRTLAERAYTPWIDMQRELLRSGHLLLSLESARPLCDFDVVGFSLQYELTYTNVLTMLDLGGVPLRTEHRSDGDPLVVAGGPVATHAEPLSPFIDAFLIGDGEEAATEIAVCWARAKRRGLPREERLYQLSRIGGVYVPSLYETTQDPDTGFEVLSGPKREGVPFPIERRFVPDLRQFPFPDDGPVGGPEAIFDRMSIEVARGCTEGCRFCQAGMIYRPVRERDPEQIVNTVLSALDKSGQDEVSLTALSTADVSCIAPLIQRLVEKTAPERVSLGVASLRAYGLAENLLDDLRRVRAHGLTFAPEAGTQRMRDVINKNVTEEQLLETAERVFGRGFDSMKLYFILGLPTEEDEDVLSIAEVGKNALAVGKRVSKSRPKVTISVSSHVPKPHTPFQWCAMDPSEEITRKQGMLRESVRGVRGLGLRTHDSRTSVLEGVLARGDRTLAPLIERAYLNGARFDSWEDQLRLDVWQEALSYFRIDTERFLGTIPVGARLPWDHIDVGLEDGFLAREYRKALASRLSPPCGKAKGMFVHHTNVEEASHDSRRLVCYDCGIACDMGKMRETRIGFLERMGADKPGLRARLPVLPVEHARESKKRLSPESLRPVREGGPAERLRLTFTKTGPSALLGHLDLIRELPRVIRRAGIRTAYTRGFHPKPDMTFGPALSLGVASLGEYLDVRLIDAPEPHQLVQRLNVVSSGGIRFTGAARLGPEDPRVSAVIDGARYVVALARSVVDELGGIRWLESKLADFNGAETLRVRRSIEGIGKIVDVKQFVLAIRIGDASAHRVLEEAGIVGNTVSLEITLRIGSNGSAKITEVIEALTSDRAFPFKAVRAALTGQGHSPMDLDRYRKMPQRVEEVALGTAG